MGRTSVEAGCSGLTDTREAWPKFVTFDPAARFVDSNVAQTGSDAFHCPRRWPLSGSVSRETARRIILRSCIQVSALSSDRDHGRPFGGFFGYTGFRNAFPGMFMQNAFRETRPRFGFPVPTLVTLPKAKRLHRASVSLPERQRPFHVKQNASSGAGNRSRCSSPRSAQSQRSGGAAGIGGPAVPRSGGPAVRQTQSHHEPPHRPSQKSAFPISAHELCVREDSEPNWGSHQNLHGAVESRACVYSVLHGGRAKVSAPTTNLQICALCRKCRVTCQDERHQ